MNEYPRDEFDAVPENSRREGAHRTFVQLRDPRKGVWPIVICGVLALVVGLVSYFVIAPKADKAIHTEPSSTSASQGAAGTGSKAPESTGASQTPSASGSATPSATPLDTPTETPSETRSSSESTPSSSESSSSPATSSSSADVKKSTRVGVYNGTGVSGLAGGSSSTLRGAGFANTSTGNWTKRAAVSAVYYKTSDLADTAKEIASELGISAVVQTSNIPSAVSVVIGSDKLTR